MDERYEKLLQGNDEYVFLNGGCHVFALALHQRCRYPLVCLRDSSSNCVPHVYCRYAEYLVDVMGFNPEQDILEAQKWTPHDGYSAEEVTPLGLEQSYIFVFPCHGLYGNPDFLLEARTRADTRIRDYIVSFDGTCKQSIKRHRFLNEMRADSDNVFNQQ